MRRITKILCALSLAFSLHAPFVWAQAEVLPSADMVDTDTTNFDTNLSAADNTVQKALDTLDEVAGSAPGADSVGTNQLNDGTDTPATGECVLVDSSDTSKFEYQTCPGGGSAITLDIGDDAGNDSIDLNEIATTGDTNNIVTEPSPDKMLIDMGQNWPTADTANAGDSATAFFSSGTIEHERGGLKADVSAYAGLVRISGGATSAVTNLSGLNTALGSSIADGAHTTDTKLTQEEVEDFAGALIADGTGTHTGIAVTYQDATGDVDMVVDHDAATNFVPLEHIDWTGASAGTIDETNYSVELDDIGAPGANHSITMSNKTLTFNFTNPAGGMTWNWTGAASGHLLDFTQSGGNPGAGTHLIHVGHEDPDVLGMHLNPTVDAASVEILRMDNERATPAANDEIYHTYYLHDSASNDTEFGRISVVAADETDTTEDGTLTIDLIQNASLTEVFTLNSVGDLQIDGDLTVSDGDITLGTTSIFSGGDTASLNNVDAIDATTETTLEAALDLNELQGAVTDAQVPNTITIDLATLATTLTITDNESTAETNAILFTSAGDLDGGNLGIESDGDLTYTPSTGTLAATTVTGANITSGANPGHTHTTTSISGLDISDDLNLTCGTNCTLTGDEISVDDAFVINSGNDTMAGTLTADGLTLGSTELITIGAQTLTHNATDFVFDDEVTVPDAAYGVGWNGDLGVPTKNAVYDKIETIGGATVSGSFGITIDGGGSAITTGVKGYAEVPYAMTIDQATFLCDQSGSIVVDVWKDTYANYPPTDADSITASAPPTITTATKSQDTTLTGWTTSVTAEDIIGFNVDSATTVQRCHLIISGDRS